MEPYTNVDGDLSYIPLRLMDDPGPQTRNSTDKTLLSELVYFSRISDRLANMTTNLTVVTSGVANKTNITCSIILVGSENSNRSATMYFAGIVQECVLG